MTEEPPRLNHNRSLAAAYIAAAGNPPRFPAVSEQAQCVEYHTASPIPMLAYNPSVWIGSGKALLTYRYHFAGDYRTKLGVAGVNATDTPAPRDIPIEGHSVEDGRLFTFQSEPWLSWVESNFTGQANPTSIVKYAKLESGLSVGRVFQVKVSSNDGTHQEKNWCFFESEENLFCIYDSAPEHTVLHVQGDAIIHEDKSPGVQWPYGFIRGGNIVPYGDKLLRFFHSRTDIGAGKIETRYYVGAAVMDRRPPFKVEAVSKRPILYGSELPKADVFHFKPNVVFPCGAIVDGDGWLVSVGINDSSCLLVKLTESMLNL